jgi:hypothetical protein
MQTINKKRVFATVALMIIAVTTIAYAQLLLGVVTVTTEEAVTIAPQVDTFPARSTGNKTYDNMITLNFLKGGFAANDSVRVRVELVVDDPRIHEGFTSLVIEILNATDSIKSTLTLNTPYGEFAETVPNPVAAKSYNVKIIFATGETELTDVPFKLSATIIGSE